MRPRLRYRWRVSVPPLSALIPGWPAQPRAERRLALVDGEGIGPEVIGAARTVLSAVDDAMGLGIAVDSPGPIGAMGSDGFGLDEEAIAFYDDALTHGVPVLTGPAGGRFVYELRARYDLFAKLVPVQPSPVLADASIVRPERIFGVDVLIVRDNVGGMYQGTFGRRHGGDTAFQQAEYTRAQVERLINVAVAAAHARTGRLAVVTKPGGIPTISALWREVAEQHAGHAVAIEVIEVDNACFQLVADPHRFDVVAAPNMLGDVVADTAALVLGSRGMSYSANFRADGAAVYQTGHGAALDLAGQDVANPVAQLRSLAWLLRESLDLGAAADAVQNAVDATLAAGIRTRDIAGPGRTPVGTRAFAESVAERVAVPAVAAG